MARVGWLKLPEALKGGGSILGQTLVKAVPDKVKRVVRNYARESMKKYV